MDSSAVEFVDENVMPTDGQLRRLANLSEIALILESEIVELTKTLRNKIDIHRHVTEIDIPNAMEECGIKDFTLSNGQKLKIKESYIGSKVTDDEAIEWVEKNGGEDIIKASITVELPTNELEVATRIYRWLRGHPAANRFTKLLFEKSIHHSTIGSFARSSVEEGKDPPLEKLGVHYKRAAVIGTKARTKAVEIKGLEFKE